jgi:hypothetical protein
MTDDRHPTERAYDDEMSPLVAQLIALAKRHKIPLLVSAGMRRPDGGQMTCDTLIIHGRKDPDSIPGIENRLNLAHAVVRGHAGFDNAAGLMISRFHEDAPEDKRVTAGFAITVSR